MGAKRTFISFDFDHDSDLPIMLAGQAANPDTPFEIKDRSIKEPLTGDWKEKVKKRMNNVDLVIIICGEWTHTATGVSAELTIARETNRPYFLLWGRNGKTCTKPTSAFSSDTIYEWTWPTLNALIGGAR